ncbi:MAG TPA: hypothetical protein VHS78_09845 [Candidatus Elarobacter sp.]|jgi:hypothetical protein|nr:hypothetical protein [Candidatus Elarobacter sp.]
MAVRRLVGPLVLLVLIVAVVAAIFFSTKEASKQRAARAVVIVRGLVGSEKETYLHDPRVLDELRRNGFDLRVETSGSREMTTRTDLASYDFTWPAGVPAASRLKTLLKAKDVYTPFFTPMTVASWKPIANILIANRIVSYDGSHYMIVDMPKMLAMEDAGKRWRELRASSAYDVNKSVLVSTTDPRKSNSGVMYAALASYVLNGNQVLQSTAQVDKVEPKIVGLFLRQGFEESSSAGPFEDYVEIGMGKAPLVMIYESQFIEYELEHPNEHGDKVLLYPRPTIYTKHVFVPVDDKGDRLGQLFANDPVLQHLAVEHGFRIQDTAYSSDFWSKAHVAVPGTLIDVVDPPSYEFLEELITGVERAYRT